MKRKLLALLAIFCCLCINSLAENMRAGLNLDIARRFYSEAQILRLIDGLHAQGADYLQLHVSDNENYALESVILGQLSAQAEWRDGCFVNPITGLSFLSFAQLKRIADYAHKNNIDIVVELDSPAHTEGILRLLTEKEKEESADVLRLEGYEQEMDIRKPAVSALIKSLISELHEQALNEAKVFHIGMDEFAMDEYTMEEHLCYVDNLHKHVKSLGMQCWIWNDGVTKSNVQHLPKDIHICYWSYDGDVENETYQKENRALRASLDQTVENGLSVSNYNSHYLYYVPSTADTPHDALEDIRENWTIGIWDGENRDNALHDTANIRGACVSLWGEDSSGLDTDTLLDNALLLVKAMQEKFVQE